MELNDESILKNKNEAISKINEYLDACFLLDKKHKKKVNLLSYWLKDYMSYIEQEESFDSSKLKKYSRGDIIKVNLGFNIGNEEGGLHYCVVLDKKNAKSYSTLTVVPLSSLKDSTKLNKTSVLLGNEIYNATKLELEDITRGANYLTTVLDCWTPDNLDASTPRLTWNDTNRNARSESDRFLEDGSYFRMRSLQLGYTFPNTWFKGFIRKARVYINMDNLFTITSYSGFSPDVNSSDTYSRGFDEFIYPSNRTFMLGINATF